MYCGKQLVPQNAGARGNFGHETKRTTRTVYRVYQTKEGDLRRALYRNLIRSLRPDSSQ